MSWSCSTKSRASTPTTLLTRCCACAPDADLPADLPADADADGGRPLRSFSPLTAVIMSPSTMPSPAASEPGSTRTTSFSRLSVMPSPNQQCSGRVAPGSRCSGVGCVGATCNLTVEINASASLVRQSSFAPPPRPPPPLARATPLATAARGERPRPAARPWRGRATGRRRPSSPSARLSSPVRCSFSFSFSFSSRSSRHCAFQSLSSAADGAAAAAADDDDDAPKLAPNRLCTAPRIHAAAAPPSALDGAATGAPQSHAAVSVGWYGSPRSSGL